MSRHGIRKTNCPKCNRSIWLYPNGLDFVNDREGAAFEILRRSSDPDELVRALVAAWDAQCDRTLEMAGGFVPDAPIEEMRANLRSNFSRWRHPVSVPQQEPETKGGGET